ncbi:MAG: S8 family serine peptidase [Clostridia bacterium]|nr:S8 family serine peptidase [Clostridia bacterium]
MKKIRLYRQISIFSFLLLYIVFFGLNTTRVNAMGISEIDNLLQYSLDAEFEEDSIIVVLDDAMSGINKVHSKEFFGDIVIDHIKDLTWRENEIKNNNVKFNQILQISLKNSSKEKILQSIQILQKINGIESIEPNFIFDKQSFVNDINYSSLWGLGSAKGINAEGAWGITTGSKNVRVGILDTGIEAHEDLIYNLIDGYDFYNNNNITTDDAVGHGTHVAGIIGATANNNFGVVGVNWEVTMVPFIVHGKMGDFFGMQVHQWQLLM